jgi:hypothetical protein
MLMAMYLCADVGPLGFGAGLTSILAALAGLGAPAFSEAPPPSVSVQCAPCLHCMPPVLQIAQVNELNSQH